RQEVPPQCGVWFGPLECIILSVKELYMDAQEDMHMNDYNKITALYSRLSVGDEDRDGGESNSIQNQKIFLENYARGQRLTNIRHYIDDDESGRFFDRSAYSRMMEDVENGKIGVCIMKDLTRWGRDYLQVGNAMEIFRRNNVRFIAVNNGIDSEKPDTLEFAPFINIMSEWDAKDISKKVKTGIKTKGMSGKPIATEAHYGYVKDPDNKDFWIIDEEAAEVVRLIFRLCISGKNRNQIAVYLKNEQKLERYMGLVRQIKEKTKERKNLLAEKKETPFYQIPKLRDLIRRIAELTEEFEELKTEKEMLLRSLDCADDTGISSVKKDIAAMESALKKLEAQETKYSAELDAALKEYSELKEQASEFDAGELMEARLSIRGEKERSAVTRVQDTYGEKYDSLMMFDSKRDVANLLHEEAETRS